MEHIVIILIAVIAGGFLVRHFRRRDGGCPGCGNCSKKCAFREDDGKTPKK